MKIKLTYSRRLKEKTKFQSEVFGRSFSFYKKQKSRQRLGVCLSLLLFNFNIAWSQQKRVLVMEVAANVVYPSPIELYTIQNINIHQSLPDNNSVYISPNLSPDAGMVIIRGTAGSSANIICPRSVEIVEESGAGLIQLEYKLALSPIRNQQLANIIEEEVIAITFNNDGLYFLWIGGLISVKNAHPGIYNGVFTFEIDYL